MIKKNYNNGFTKVRDIMFEYPLYRKQIDMIKDEIMTPYNENTDENIGGSRSSFSKMFEQDKYVLRTEYFKPTLERIFLNKRVVEDCLKEIDPNFKKYIEGYYFSNMSKQKAIAISGYSWSHLKRKRNDLFRRIAFKLGIFWTD